MKANNEEIEVTFLGTGTSQGVPVIGCKCRVCRSLNTRDQRLRSSVLVRMGDVTIVIDTSMDFRQQMLREGVKSINAVLYTHEHRDHTGGLDDLRAFNYVLNRPIDVFCTLETSLTLKQTFNYAFAQNPYPGVPELILHMIDDKPFIVNGIEVVPIQGKHYVFNVTGFRIGDFVYMTDFNFIEDSELEKIRGCKVLVINALRKKEHISHFNLAQALDLIERVGPQTAYLTHISHQMGLYEDVRKELPANVILSYDGLKLFLG